MNIRDSYIHGADGKGVVKSLYFATSAESVSKADFSANYTTAAGKDLIFLLADTLGTKVGLPIPTLNLNTTGYASSLLTVKSTSTSNHYLTFVDSNNTTAKAENFYTSGDIYFKPSTGVLTVKSITVNNTFNYSGIGSDTTSNAARKIWFASSSDGTPVVSDNFKYNPSTKTLTVDKISGPTIVIGNTTLYLDGANNVLTPDTVISNTSTNNTVPSSKAVWDAILAGMKANDAMIFKGFLDGGTDLAHTIYTAGADAGYTYKVRTAGYINGSYYQVNDTFICTVDGTVAATSSNVNTIKANWGVVEGNGDYLSYKGGTMYGTLSWDGTTALPTVTTASSILVVDSNTTKQISLADLRNIIDLKVYVASAASGTNGKKQITAAQTDPYYNIIYGDTIIRSIQFKHGDNMSISSTTAGVITFTATNTWRSIYVGGSLKATTATNTKAMNFASSNLNINYLAAGTSTGLSGNANYFTISLEAKNWSGATSSAAGTAGYMPAPTSTQRGQFLRGDGSWVDVATFDHTHSVIINGITKTINASGGTAVNLGDYVPKIVGTGSVVAHQTSVLEWDGCKIVIPGGYNTWMIAFTVRVYIGYLYTDIVFSGYHYGSNHWYSPSARVIGGSKNYKIVMGYEGNNLYVWLGNTNGTKLDYGGITVMNLHAGHSDAPDWYTTWSISNVAYANLVNKQLDTTTVLPAMSDHTHTLSIATDTGENQLTLTPLTKYKLTAGGSTYIFTTPANTWREIYVNGTSQIGTGSNTKALNITASGNLSVGYVATGTGTGQSSDYSTISIDAVAWSGATSEEDGIAGYMPAPTIANRLKFLRGDGSWITLSQSDHTHSVKIHEQTKTIAASGGTAVDLGNYVYLAGDTMIGYLGHKSKYIIKPVADFRCNNGSHTGCITITLPASIGNTMVSMWIDVYNYSTNTSFSVHVGGYTYENNTWPNPFALVYGANHRVRFAHNGTNFIIYIGETNTVWSYPQVTIRDVTLGHNPTWSNWIKDWTISFSTTMSTAIATIDRYVAYTNNIINKDATISSSLTTIATIAGVDIKAKIKDIPQQAIDLFNNSKTLTVNTWTTIAAIDTLDAGTYAIQINSGTLYASGVFTACHGTDLIIDEIPLHVSDTDGTWRPYARISGANLLMTTNETTGVARTYTVKILKLI